MLSWIKNLFIRTTGSNSDKILKYPAGRRYYSDFHNIRKSHIDPDAQKVIGRLSQFGFKAYIVGGCVRDLLLSRQPKDYDIVTNATPAEVRKLFVNSRVIGRRFKIVHVVFKGNKIIEVSTARSLPSTRKTAKKKDELLLTRDNEFGTFKEDAARRDFTLNSLFFDIRNESIIDYTGGYEDITQKIVRTIGDENVSLPEDPVRMLRAVKFASLLEFALHPRLIKGIKRNKKHIQKASTARLHEEYNKIFRTGQTYNIIKSLVELSLFDWMFPTIAKKNAEKDSKWTTRFEEVQIGKQLFLADRMIAEHEDVNTMVYYSIFAGSVAEEFFTMDPKDRSIEPKLKDLIEGVSQELGLSRRESERMVQIFSGQRSFSSEVPDDALQDMAESVTWVETFKNKAHFIETFVFYKLRMRASQNQEGIQRALYWEIGLRKKLPQSIRKIRPRPLALYEEDNRLGKKEGFFSSRAKKFIRKKPRPGQR
ncbi:MAG: polynucleotide adenylyltransferase PcnB [Leptospirales bacterium]